MAGRADTEGEPVKRAMRDLLIARLRDVDEPNALIVRRQAAEILIVLEADLARERERTTTLREAVETLDLSDAYTLDNAAPGELVSVTRPVEFWRELRAALAASLPAALARERERTTALEAVLMDSNVTYGIAGDDGSASPMMVERAAIVKALGYEDESAWLARTAEINEEARCVECRRDLHGYRGLRCRYCDGTAE